MNIKYLNNLTIAKESLNVWLSNVEQLHLGNQMFAKANDLDRNNTPFSIWYKGEGQTFSSFETFMVLEPFYNEMYDLFITYYNLLYQPIKKSLFSNEKEKREKELDLLFQKLKQNSRKLTKSVELFEEKLKTSPLFAPNEVTENIEKSTTSIHFSENNPFENIDFFEKEEIDTVSSYSNFFKEKKDQETKQEENLSPQKTEPIDFEKKFQEAALKLRRDLEAEKKNKIQSSQEESIQTQSTKSNSKESVGEVSIENPTSQEIKPEAKKPDDAIDVAEEIRRILS